MCKAVNLIEIIVSSIKEVDIEFDRLIKEQSRLDLTQEDLLHLIENDNFNAAEGYFYAKRLKDVRMERRDVKNELEPLASLRDSLHNQKLEFGKIETRVKNIDVKLKRLKDNKVYSPRILKVAL